VEKIPQRINEHNGYKIRRDSQRINASNGWEIREYSSGCPSPLIVFAVIIVIVIGPCFLPD